MIEVARRTRTESMWCDWGSFDLDIITTRRAFVKLNVSCKNILPAEGLMTMWTREGFVLYVCGTDDVLVSLQSSQGE
jgi:hypothetical protein